MTLGIKPIITSQLQQRTNQSTKSSKQNVSFGSNLAEELIIETAKIAEKLNAEVEKASDPATKAAIAARNSRIFQDLNIILTGH